MALKSATKILGVDFPETEEIAGMAREVGFEDVEVHAMKVPIGPWAKRRDLKEMGRFYLMSLETGFEVSGDRGERSWDWGGKG